MLHHYTRMASLVLAFGFFFGCSSTEPTSGGISSESSENLSEAQLKQRISDLDKQLQSDQYNPALHYHKGALLIKQAQQKEDLIQRGPLYSEADLLLKKADSLSGAKPNDNIDTLRYDKIRRVAWSNEHNQGIQISQNASSEKDHQKAALHFNNAAVIMPDSSISYQMASQSYYKGGEPQKAIDILESARINAGPLHVELLESLAFLYVETDQLPEAISIYKEARSLLSHNFNIMHGLSNAYIEAEDHQNAIDILQELAQRKPDNTRYQYSLASEFYKSGRKEIIAMASDLEEQKEFNSSSYVLADSLFDQAEAHYEYILEKKPGDSHFIFETVQFYQNKAAQYQRLLPYVKQPRKKEITKVIEENIAASVPLLEQLTEQQPTKRMWEYLYRTYSYLGMQAEAEKAKANF